ncbi:hypothetical protein QU38_02710, partial [Staphylococcus aureus]
AHQRNHLARLDPQRGPLEHIRFAHAVAIEAVPHLDRLIEVRHLARRDLAGILAPGHHDIGDPTEMDLDDPEVHCLIDQAHRRAEELLLIGLEPEKHAERQLGIERRAAVAAGELALLGGAVDAEGERLRFLRQPLRGEHHPGVLLGAGGSARRLLLAEHGGHGLERLAGEAGLGGERQDRGPVAQAGAVIGPVAPLVAPAAAKRLQG